MQVINHREKEKLKMEAGLIQTILKVFSFSKLSVTELDLSMFEFDKREVSEAFFFLAMCLLNDV